jgi:imidazolonepropionase-like amidohydrolase
MLLPLLAALAALDSTAYIVLNHGRPAGAMQVITRGDSILVRYHHVDRNRGPRIETHYVIRNGVVEAGETWQLPLVGPAPSLLGRPADRFQTTDGRVQWPVGDSVRSAPRTPASWYRLRSGTPFDVALLAKFLLSRPDSSAQMLPQGTARVRIVADTTVRIGRGSTRLRLAMIREGNSPASRGVWLDPQGNLFASEIGWFITVRPEHAHLLPALRAFELRFHDAEGEALARRIRPASGANLAITNGNLFDSERGVMVPRVTVLIRDDRVVAVGPADSIAVPAGATVIDAAGKTVMPGMWDMHTHLFPTSQLTSGPAQLATGLTTVRDLASDLDVAVSHRNRAATGAILSPRIVLAGFLDGPGRWAGPSEAIVSTEAEALAWIARYDSLGYRQIKLYNLVQQDLVPAIAAETHRRSMRLSGHVPRGLSTQTAVRLGFDEINHIAFLYSTFFPDSLYLPSMRAYSAVAAAVAPRFDVNAPEVTAMIELFREKGTVMDPTVGVFAAGNDSLAAGYLRMLKRLYDAGLSIVPGTDGSSYNAELEYYEKAGIPAPKVLQIATLVPARVMNEEKDYGSIAPGKVADLLIVNGNPAERIADLRKVEQVVRAGRAYEVRALRSAAGF